MTSTKSSLVHQEQIQFPPTEFLLNFQEYLPEMSLCHGLMEDWPKLVQQEQIRCPSTEFVLGFQGCLHEMPLCGWLNWDWPGGSQWLLTLVLA